MRAATYYNRSINGAILEYELSGEIFDVIRAFLDGKVYVGYDYMKGGNYNGIVDLFEQLDQNDSNYNFKLSDIKGCKGWVDLILTDDPELSAF